MPNTIRENALLVIDRLRQEIGEMPIDLPAGDALNIMVSIGVAMMEVDVKVEDAITKADKASMLRKLLAETEP